MKQYIIVKGYIDQIEGLVNEAMDKGYVPHGNLMLFTNGMPLQAMVYSPKPNIDETINKMMGKTESKTTKK